MSVEVRLSGVWGMNSLVGRNLLEDEHAEFGAQQPAKIPREAYIEALLHF
jgi:hypothetical protein